MISALAAAGLIGGMTQATRELGQQWEALSDTQRAEFLEHWAEIIDSRSPDAPELILTSISQHPSLAESWQILGSDIHDSRRNVIAAILRDT